MDLEDFIATTLISIRSGVKKANIANDQNYYINTNTQVVNFDVAVEVTNEKSSEKGGGLRVHVVEGKIGGSSKNKESNVSRINFTVGVKGVIQ